MPDVRMEDHPRWVIASLWLGLAILAVPPSSLLALVCCGLTITAATRWALHRS